MRPCSAITCRCRSRGVGSVSAVGLGTAFDRGGTMTAASGWRTLGYPDQATRSASEGVALAAEQRPAPASL
jgi:hypothetical protein